MKDIRIHDNFASKGYNIICNIEITLEKLDMKAMFLPQEWSISEIDEYIKKYGDKADKYYVELATDGKDLFYDQYEKYINNESKGV